MPRRIHISDLEGHVGQELGSSSWHLVTQERINDFANATGDHQWIHVDRDRAARSPLGSTIAHGYLTLSLGPALLDEVLAVENCAMVVNYGADRLRFPAPLRSGQLVRLNVTLARTERPADGSLQAALELYFEIRGSEKPCCVAEILLRYYPDAPLPQPASGRRVDASWVPLGGSRAVYPDALARAWLSYTTGTLRLATTLATHLQDANARGQFAPCAAGGVLLDYTTRSSALVGRLWADTVAATASCASAISGQPRVSR